MVYIKYRKLTHFIFVIYNKVPLVSLYFKMFMSHNKFEHWDPESEAMLTEFLTY